jgi:hypothetical protein
VQRAIELSQGTGSAAACLDLFAKGLPDPGPMYLLYHAPRVLSRNLSRSRTPVWTSLYVLLTAQTHTHTYIYIHTYTHTHTHIYTHIYTYTHVKCIPQLRRTARKQPGVCYVSPNKQHCCEEVGNDHARLGLTECGDAEVFLSSATSLQG